MVYVPPPELITKRLIMLCEGDGDKQFFLRLVRSRGLPEFDFPFPPIHPTNIEGTSIPTLHGRDAFINMLGVLNNYFKLFEEKRAFVQGILIAIDAADDARKSFDHVRKQIADAGGFGVPNRALEIARNASHPPVAVLMVPGGERVGGLETLCVEALAEFGKEMACMKHYFTCCPTDFSKWNRETYDKAQLRCLIAATYEADPTRSTSTLFAKLKNKPPAIDIGKQCFNPLAGEIEAFCKSVGAM